MTTKRIMGALLVALLLGGCDSGPEGPGDLTASFTETGGPVGGAVLEVVGKGIVQFSGAAGSKVFWAGQDGSSVYRVIVLGEGAGAPSFTASVEDVGDRLPRVTVVSLVDQNNVPIPVTGSYEVKFKR
jgi:hypothetical protein